MNGIMNGIIDKIKDDGLHDFIKKWKNDFFPFFLSKIKKDGNDKLCSRIRALL